MRLYGNKGKFVLVGYQKENKCLFMLLLFKYLNSSLTSILHLINISCLLINFDESIDGNSWYILITSKTDLTFYPC